MAQWEEAARQEGKLTLYTVSNPEAAQKAAVLFSDRYGIEVEIQRLTTGALAERFLAEHAAGADVADVLIIGDATFMDKQIADGLIVSEAKYPALADWPAPYWNGASALIGTNVELLLWNTDLISEADAPKSWTDLLKPQWKGKIMFVDPRNIPAFMSWALLMRKTYGDAFLTGLAAQDMQLTDSVNPGSQAVAAGEAAILLPGVFSVLGNLQKAGAPIAFAVPDVTSGVENVGGVVAAAPHPNAARFFFNWLLTPEGQTVFTVEGNNTSVLNIPGSAPLPAQYESPKLAEASEARNELIQLLGLE